MKKLLTLLALCVFALVACTAAPLSQKDNIISSVPIVQAPSSSSEEMEVSSPSETEAEPTDEEARAYYESYGYDPASFPQVVPSGELTVLTEGALSRLDGRWDHYPDYPGYPETFGGHPLYSFEFDSATGMMSWGAGWMESEYAFYYIGQFGMRDGGVLIGTLNRVFDSDEYPESITLTLAVSWEEGVQHSTVFTVQDVDSDALLAFAGAPELYARDGVYGNDKLLEIAPYM